MTSRGLHSSRKGEIYIINGAAKAKHKPAIMNVISFGLENASVRGHKWKCATCVLRDIVI